MNMKTIETVVLDCGHVASEHCEHTTGYGVTPDGKKHCWACCAEADKKQMRDAGKITLYLTIKPLTGPTYSHGNYRDCTISNWPGSLKLTGRSHKGNHNIAGSRYNVWFKFEGQNWRGVQYGENTQLLHCKRVA